MIAGVLAPYRVALVTAVAAALLSGCSLIPTREPPPPTSVYELSVDRGPTAAASPDCGRLLVEPPEPAPGYLTSHMIYTREAYRLEQFAWSQWADTPTAMLEPLMLTALAESGAFAAVLAPPAPVDYDLSLVVRDVRLLLRFADGASEAEISAHVALYYPRARLLLSDERMVQTEPADAATPAAGVAAANRAVAGFLERLATFAATGAGRADGLCKPASP